MQRAATVAAARLAGGSGWGRGVVEDEVGWLGSLHHTLQLLPACQRAECHRHGPQVLLAGLQAEGGAVLPLPPHECLLLRAAALQ